MPADLAPATLPKCPVHHRDCPLQVSSLLAEDSRDLCHPASCPLFLAAVIVIACTVHQTARWIFLRGLRDADAGRGQGRGEEARAYRPALEAGGGDDKISKSFRRKKVKKARARALKQRLRFPCSRVCQPRRKRPGSSDDASVTPGSVGSASVSLGSVSGGGAVATSSSRAVADVREPLAGSLKRSDHREPGAGYRKRIQQSVCNRIGRFWFCFRRSKTVSGLREPTIEGEVEDLEAGYRGRRRVGASDVTIIPFEGDRAVGEAQQSALRRLIGDSESDSCLMGGSARGDDLVTDEKWDAAIDLTLRRFVYSTAGGAVAALTLFRNPTTRWSAIAFGAGLGLGSALMDSSYILNDSRPTRPYNSR